MATSCNFKTSEASTKSFFRTRGLIDQYLNIKDLIGFRKANTKWSNYARIKFGVEGRLFSEKEITGSNYQRYNQAIPNTEMFKKLDSKKGITTFYQMGDNKVNYQLKAVNILMSDKAKQVFEKGKKNNWPLDKILTELAIPKEQKQLLLDLNIKDREQLAVELASKYSYSVEVKTAKATHPQGEFDEDGQWTTYEDIEQTVKPGENAAYYSNLTVPGGTNYTENEISTPLITPSIKGHAQFSTDQGIGWFRSDDRSINADYSIPQHLVDMGIEPEPIKGTSTKTRRILELQSDLFQKGRDKKDLISKTYKNYVSESYTEFGDTNTFVLNGYRYNYNGADEYNNWTDKFSKRKIINNVINNESKEFITENEFIEAFNTFKNTNIIKEKEQNQFLQLLNKDSNWVTFFIKSIIQDSAKKGYEKVLFPKGETAAKIEGHETIADRIENIDKKIKTLQSTGTITHDIKGTPLINKEYRLDAIGYGRTWHTTRESAENTLSQLIDKLEEERSNTESQGIEKLKPIEAFYEIKVGNILEKVYGKDNVKTITDEYGNEWREIDLSNEKVIEVSSNIQLQLENEAKLQPDAKIEAKIKEWLNAVGIDYKPTNKIHDINGKEISAIAKADIFNKTIEVIEGKRDITTLPEEAGHFFVELIGEDNVFFKKMMKDITQYEVYNEVLNSPYAEIYQGDEEAIKKEAVGKLIAKHIIAKELGGETPEQIKKIENFFNYIWSYLRNKLKSLIGSPYREEINAFEYSAEQILNNSTEGLKPIEEVVPKYNNIFYELDQSVQSGILEKLEKLKITYDVKDKKYYQNGIEVSKRVSNLVKAYYKRRFRHPQEEETPKSKLLAMKGTVIHAYNQVIMNNIIANSGNIEGFTKGTVETEVINSLKEDPEFAEKSNGFFFLKPKEFVELQTLSKNLYDRIQQQQDEINKQTGRNDKAVILTEQILYDANKDEAGTVDVMAVFSNGVVSIYDYKGINFFTTNGEVVSDIPMYKQEAYDIQILEYMNILRDNFGIESFAETRIIPINLQLKTNSEDGFYKVEAGSKAPDSSYREYLEEFPVTNELTGIAAIDQQLNKMFKLRDKEKALLNKNPGNATIKIRLQKIIDSIRKLQVNKDTRFAYKEVQSIITEYNKRKVLHESNKDSFTLADLSDYEEYLRVYQGFFEDAIDIETSKSENEEEQDKIAATYFRINKHINVLLDDIKNKRIEILQREFGKDMTKVSKEPSWLGLYFNQLSEFSRNQFKALSQLVKNGEVEVRENVNRIKDIIETKQEVLKKWADAKGISLQDAYDKIYDSKTGQLKRKFTDLYKTEKSQAIKDNDVKWFLENTQIERDGEFFKYSDPELQKKFEETRKKQFNIIDKNYPGKQNASIRDKNKLKWITKHDITQSAEALFNQPYYIRPKDNERFYTDSWKTLNQEENKPLLDMYNTFIELNREFSQITGKDLSDYNVAEVQKDMIDILSTNGVRGLGGIKDYLNNSLEVQQQDNLLGSGNIDPNTGEYIHSIPFLFTSELTQSISDKEFENLKQEVLKKFPDNTSVAYKDELKLQVLKLQREKGLKTKSNNLGRSFILLAEAAYTNAYLNDTLETVKALRETLENSSTELTDKTNKTFIDKYTRKVMSKVGVPSSELEAFDKFTNLYWYGRKIQNKDILIKKESTELSELLGQQRSISSNKVAKGLMTYISAKALGLSWITSVGSAIGAFSNLMFQASEGRFFNIKEVIKSCKLLIQGDTKANLLIKYFEAYAKDMTYEKANQLSASKLSKLITMDNLYIMMKKPDEFVDKISMLSILQHYGIHKGKIDRLSKLPKGTKSLYDLADIKDDKLVIEGLNRNNYILLRTLMQKASSKVKGSIPQEDQNLAGTNIGVAMLMHFKNWIPAMVKDRGQTLTYDEDLNDLDIGRFRVFFGEFTAKGVVPKLNAFKDTLLEVIALGKYNRYNKGKISEVAQKYYNKFLEENPTLKDKVSIEDFIELRRAKLQGMARELRQYLFLFSLVALLKAAVPPEDEEDNGLSRAIAMNAYRLSNRGLLELGFFLNPSSFLQITKKPVAVLGLFDDITKITRNTFDETRDVFFGEDTSRDKTPVLYYSSKMIPGGRAVLDIFDIFDNFKTQ